MVNAGCQRRIRHVMTILHSNPVSPRIPIQMPLKACLAMVLGVRFWVPLSQFWRI